MNSEPVREGPPTALWVVPVADLGGVARHVLDAMLAGLPGWRTVLLAPEGPLIDRCRSADLPVLAGPIGPAHGTLRSVMTLRRAIDHVRPDVVHSHLAYADLVAALATSGRAGPTSISTEHGIAADDRLYRASRLRSRATNAVHRWRLRSIDGLIAVSDSTATEMQRRWRPPAGLPVVVIHNGIDRSPIPQRRVAGLRVASLSRLAPEKGLDRVLDAFAALRSTRPEATLTIAGDGPEREHLIDRCTRMGLAEVVDFPGHVDPRDLLGRTDVLLQLSAWENCSYSILDAVGAGVGVVATAVGGNPEILPDRCLTGTADADDVAARIIEQGLAPDRRPDIPAGWPTVAAMTEAIAAFYEEVIR